MPKHAIVLQNFGVQTTVAPYFIKILFIVYCYLQVSEF